MDGLTGPRATRIAAFGTGLTAAHGLVNVVRTVTTSSGFMSSGKTASLLISAVSVLSSAIWYWFFSSLYQAECGLKVPIRRVLIATALCVLVPRALVLALQSYSSIFFDSLGIFTVTVAALAILLWAALLILVGRVFLGRHVGGALVESIAVGLIVLTACQSFGSIMDAITALTFGVKGGLGPAVRADPMSMVWWRILTPVVNLFYWISQILFLIALRQDPHGMLPVAQHAGVPAAEERL